VKDIADRTEVDECKRAVRAHDEIRGLDVAMQDRRNPGVEIVEQPQRFDEEIDHVFAAEVASLGDQRLERGALHVLHHQHCRVGAFPGRAE
jgi:hypothetical protein